MMMEVYIFFDTVYIQSFFFKKVQSYEKEDLNILSKTWDYCKFKTF